MTWKHPAEPVFSIGPQPPPPVDQTKLTSVLKQVPLLSFSIVSVVGQNVDNGNLIHTFGLDSHFNVQNIPVVINVGAGFDCPIPI